MAYKLIIQIINTHKLGYIKKTASRIKCIIKVIIGIARELRSIISGYEYPREDIRRKFVTFFYERKGQLNRI